MINFDGSTTAAYLAVREDLTETDPVFCDVLRADVRNDTVALDVGCGDGRIGQQILSLGAALVVGLDTSFDMLRHAYSGANCNNRLKLIAADVRSIPVADHTFDLITANFLFHYIEHTNRSIAEIARILKPGGRLDAMLSVNTTTDGCEWLYNHTYPLVLAGRFSTMAYARSLSEFLGQVQEAGFRTLEVRAVPNHAAAVGEFVYKESLQVQSVLIRCEK